MTISEKKKKQNPFVSGMMERITDWLDTVQSDERYCVDIAEPFDEYPEEDKTLYENCILWRVTISERKYVEKLKEMGKMSGISANIIVVPRNVDTLSCCFDIKFDFRYESAYIKIRFYDIITNYEYTFNEWSDDETPHIYKRTSKYGNPKETVTIWENGNVNMMVSRHNKSVPMSLDKISRNAYLYGLFQIVFSIYFSEIQKTHIIFKDIERDFLSDTENISIPVSISKILEVNPHSKQDFFQKMYHYKFPVPKEINRETFAEAYTKLKLMNKVKENELALREAELKLSEDTAKARADAAYDIQTQEQRKTIEIATTDADIAKQEREVELKRQEARVMEEALDAQVRKKAEADKYARQQRAEADLFERQKEAEAKRYETEKETEAAKLTAEANLFQKQKEAEGVKTVGEAEAAAIEAKGKAEAESVKAKGLAEAAAMEKKAEAYKQYNNAAMAEMLIKVLPDIAGKIAEPLQQIDKITIIGGDSNGVSSVADNVPAVMAKMFESMKETTGIDLGEVVKAGTYDAMVNRNVTINGLPNSGDAAE